MEEELLGFSHAGVQEIGKLGLKFWRGRKGHSPFPFLRAGRLRGLPVLL